MPVTTGDFVTWTATGTPSTNPNWSNFLNETLSGSGWRNANIQAGASGLIITAYATRSWPTSSEVGSLFQSFAQWSGWTISRWSIRSAGEDWFQAHPSDRPGGSTTPNPNPNPPNKTDWTPYMYAGAALLLLVVAMKRD
jgi:hypothetical protein